MENVAAARGPVLIPFVCPVCAGENAVALVALSRAGGMDCQKCGRYLRSADVMRAMHSPRTAGGNAERRSWSRSPSSEKPSMVWPPTPESRAEIARRARDEGRN